MAKSKSAPKLTLCVSRDVPLNKLVLSQANVRQVKAGVSIEELAEDIARRTLLQSLTVRAVLDKAGAETGVYEVPAGGRRFRALQLLVKQKRLAPDAPIPCVVRTDGLAEEDSLAENIQRAPLHPLDQFRAFKALRDKGRSEEEIAAAFFVSASVVRQRLKLAAVSEILLDAYADDKMTLEQLMAFTVNPDPDAQSEVWRSVERGSVREPYQIRRMLTEGAVRASDRRALFVGLGAYEAAMRADGARAFYRFLKPTNADYPAMLEVFARRPEDLAFPGSNQFARIPAGNALVSLSAILLDPDYFAAIAAARRVIDGVTVVDETLLIPFKARAFLDLSARRAAGEMIDGKTILKHRNDVFRLLQLLPADRRLSLGDAIVNNLKKFVAAIVDAADFNPRDFGVPLSRDESAKLLARIYSI